MKKITLANSKGGCGKTTCTLGLVSILSSIEKKVLLFDLDPQANLTNSLITNYIDSNKIEKWFKSDSTTEELLNTFIQTDNLNVVLVPSWTELANKVLSELDKNSFGVTIFMKNIQKMQGILSEIFDYIFFDTSPKADKLLTSMLLACDSIIVPIEPHLYSYQGIDVMTKPYQEAINSINSFGGSLTNNIKYYFVNKVKKAKFHDVMLELIGKSNIDDKLLNTMIPDTIFRQQETIINKYRITEKNPFYNLYLELLEKEVL